jgi:NADPH2:quinone reductase
MRAVVCHVHGEPEDLVVEDIADPVPAPGEVLVRVGAAAVNFPDVLFVANKYQVSVPPPFVPGSEVAGEVIALGDGVDSVAVGDHVFGAMMVGAFAELVCLPAVGLMHVPSGVPLTDAAAFWVAYATAYQSLRSVADVGPGDTVLVLGAAGGVGLASVELAKVLGARVIAAASSPEKLAVCAERGADELIDYRQDNLRERLKAVAPKGVDVVIDPVGGPYADLALRGLAPGGRYVVIGFASGEIPKLAANLILLKSAKVLGFEMRTFGDVDPVGRERGERELLELLASGRIRPHISATFTLDEGPAALRWVADRKATGKVLVVP